MIGVLGGGFGLYGHLAALVELNQPIATLARYEAMLRGRPELASLTDRVVFFEHEDELLASASLLVLARRPEDNAAIASGLAAAGLATKGRELRLVIEKPIAPDPASALNLDQALRAAGVVYWTPYLFRHMPWATAIAGASGDIDVLWRFPLRNPAQSWKYDAGAGGGILSYYFIHFLPFAVVWSRQGGETGLVHARAGGVETVRMTAMGPAGRLCVSMELGETAAAFEVRSGGRVLWREDGPFGAAGERGKPDPRIPVLQRFYSDEVFGGLTDGRELYPSVLKLWDKFSRIL